MPGQNQKLTPDFERLEEGRAILASQPFSRLLGAELAQLDERRADFAFRFGTSTSNNEPNGSD